MVKVCSQKAWAFDLREQASTRILKQEIGPSLRAEVSVTAEMPKAM